MLLFDKIIYTIRNKLLATYNKLTYFGHENTIYEKGKIKKIFDVLGSHVRKATK